MRIASFFEVVCYFGSVHQFNAAFQFLVGLLHHTSRVLSEALAGEISGKGRVVQTKATMADTE